MYICGIESESKSNTCYIYCVLVILSLSWVRHHIREYVTCYYYRQQQRGRAHCFLQWKFEQNGVLYTSWDGRSWRVELYLVLWWYGVALPSTLLRVPVQLLHVVHHVPVLAVHDMCCPLFWEGSVSVVPCYLSIVGYWNFCPHEMVIGALAVANVSFGDTMNPNCGYQSDHDPMNCWNHVSIRRPTFN